MTISTWAPISKIITDITRSNPGVVTTSQPHGYREGLYVRIDMQPKPAIFGMTQVSGNVYLATILSPTTFSIDADTSNFDPFIAITVPQAPQCVAIGEVALTLRNAFHNTLTPYGG